MARQVLPTRTPDGALAVHRRCRRLSRAVPRNAHRPSYPPPLDPGAPPLHPHAMVFVNNASARLRLWRRASCYGGALTSGAGLCGDVLIFIDAHVDEEPGHSSYDRHSAAPRGTGVPQPIFVPGVGQAILLTVVPLEALYLLGSARTVTLLYVGTGLVAVTVRFSIPYLLRLVRRRFVFTLGTLSLALSSILLAFKKCQRWRLALCSVRSPSLASKSRASSTCSTVCRVMPSSTSSLSASSPAPDRGRSVLGSASTCSTLWHLPRRSASPPAPRSSC